MAGLEKIVQDLLFSIIQLVAGVAVSSGAIYLGIKVFDAFTKDIKEMEELKKGNAAVGILIAAVIISMAIVLEPQVSSLFNEVITGVSGTISIEKISIAIAVGLIRLLIGIIAAVGSVYVALSVLDKVTVDIQEQKEIQRGNVAVAIMVAGVLIAVSFLIKASVVGITNALDPIAIAVALGL